MFAGISQIGAAHPPNDGITRKILPPTPVRFPRCIPDPEIHSQSATYAGSIVDLVQSVHRPADIRPSIFEALKLHVIPDAPAEDLIPDADFLPPVQEWNTVPQDEIPEIDGKIRKPLNNGNLSPGIQTYQERQKELLIDNTAAFRSIRRIPAPVGETPARLGNAYEFYKNLEFFSGYWPDTSLPPKPEATKETTKEEGEDKDDPPLHLQTHLRTGTGSQLPPEYRQNLLTAFVKLVAYDFGCNVSFPRTEPRLYLTPKEESKPPSYFNSSVTFVYRTPTERAMARAGIVEGPVAALSARATTGFGTEAEEWLDFAREVVAVLLTAQQRAREGKTEKRFGEGKWWTSTPRWGGGLGGPIGREGDKVDELNGPQKPTEVEGAKVAPPASKIASEVKRQIGGINGPSPNKRSKKNREPGNLQIYDKYREMNPPSLTWDRKARYMSIGKAEGLGYDDIFLLSALNHHVCVVRARVPTDLLTALEGGDTAWEKVSMWRSKWFDMYLSKDRVEAMEIVWGMMAWLMRKIEPTKVPMDDADAAMDETTDKMDLS